MRQINFAKAINEGLHVAMALDPKVIAFGLGINDPKRHFSTSEGLVEKFGNERVFDMPTAENGMTGIGIGAALQGFRPVMTHQRLDFFLLAMDQLVNSAAKWHYMFGGQDSVPITIRLILGRGWGQGPTHSQNLQAWFAHIPGLKVVMPSTAANAKALLLASIFDDNPVVFLEHRWLHNQEGLVPDGDERIPLGKARLAASGKDLTIVTMSYMTIEALRAVKVLEEVGITCDVVDLLTIQPMDWETIEASIKRTGRLMAIDTGAASCSVASEIVSRASVRLFRDLKVAPTILTGPDMPVPTSVGISQSFYNTAEDIVREALRMFDRKVPEGLLKPSSSPHDVPGEWFKGPF